MSEDRNSLAYWFPPLEAAGLRVPRTEIVYYAFGDLLDLLDGIEPFGWDDLVARIRDAGERLGWPAFLRTGHGSGKHEWARCCYLAEPSDVGAHVGALVEWSAMADMFGLPLDVWAVREMIPTAPLFTCTRFDGFPVVREFRLFVRDGDAEHIQPYWPPDAVEQGAPDDREWRVKLAAASQVDVATGSVLTEMASVACDAVGGGYWSVDFLQDRDGEWWLTDMAEGERSFRWEAPVPHSPTLRL